MKAKLLVLTAALLFLADAPGLIESLRSSLERHENEELRRAAHTLKSNGSTLGATVFTELCRTVKVAPMVCHT